MLQLTKSQFDIMYEINKAYQDTREAISEVSGYSLECVNRTCQELLAEGLLTEDCRMTPMGEQVLEQYRVKNAIIFAAGMSTRFVPVSYEIPKGLTVVKGEVLIERQIRQLQEAGIDEIIVVLGHMLEKFLYLREKYGVKIVINNEYQFKNTHSSLYVARDYMDNTYVCCSDNYFPSNIFRSHEYRSIYSTLYMPGIERGERGVATDGEGLIVATQRPSVDQWVLNGYAYFNRAFSSTFKPILEEYYDKPGTDGLYWEQIYAEHVRELPLYAKKYSGTEVLEFDNVAELERFDPDYIVNNDLELIKNICFALSCNPTQIKHIKPLAKGYSNRSFVFECGDGKYVYRSPGKNVVDLIDRRIEKYALEIAKEIGIDDSYIYEDEEEGWKISHFVEETERFDFHNKSHLEMLCASLRKLHREPRACGRVFDYFEEAEKILQKIKILDRDSYHGFLGLRDEISKVNDLINADGWDIQLSHNDVYEDNLLLSSGKLYLIDWEYAGDTEIGFDLCKIFVKNDCPIDKISQYTDIYFERPTKPQEIKHLIGCAAVSFYYWYVWAKYMILKGNNFSEILYDYHDKAKKYLKAFMIK